MAESLIERSNRLLDMTYGDDRGALAPDNLSFELWTGDPREDGSAELSAAGGYAAVDKANTDAAAWPAAASGGYKTSADLDYGTSTGAFSGKATWLLIRDSDTGDAWDVCPLPTAINVTAAGIPVVVRAEPYYDLEA